VYRVKNMNISSVFYMQMSSFPSNICWRGYLFSIICFGSFVKNPVAVAVCLLFCSIGLHVYFCASIMLFLLLWLFNIVCEVRYCNASSVALFPQYWLAIWGLCASKWTLGWFFNLWGMLLRFWWKLHWTYRCFWKYSHFQFCQFMSMGDLSNICSLQFLSSMDYSFHCKGLSLPLL
jgi:hypothetical protein